MTELTEAEAKTKRCCGPWGSGEVAPRGYVGADPDGAPLFQRTCLGSACMAWRTVDQYRRDKESPEGNGWEKIDGDAYDPDAHWRRTVGWCGLARRP